MRVTSRLHDCFTAHGQASRQATTRRAKAGWGAAKASVVSEATGGDGITAGMMMVMHGAKAQR